MTKELNDGNWNSRDSFERFAFESDTDDVLAGERVSPKTEFFRNATKLIIVKNDSPDFPFEMGVNSYRGCERG